MAVQIDSRPATLAVNKRDGRNVGFDRCRIFNAISKAHTDVYGGSQNLMWVDEMTEEATREISERYTGAVQIDEIQSVVEHTLIGSGEPEVARAYIAYRANRDLQRSQATDINYSVGRLIDKDEAVVNENANKDANVFNTQRDLTAGAAAKAIGLRMLPAHVANAHQKGDIHYHDLDYTPYMAQTNCCLPDFAEMLREGYKLGNAEVESPRSIQTATAQIAQIIANVSSSQYGGVTVNRIDELLAPYAVMNYQKHFGEAAVWGIPDGKDYATARTQKDIYDAMQSLEYEINTLFTSNGQTPFTSVGFGLGTDWYSREIQKAILEVRIGGLGRDRRTAIFPKLLFTLKDGLNLHPFDPNYDIKQLALECSTKRMYPDVLSYDKIIELTGSFKASMGCRSFLQGWQDENGNDISEGRMNLGVVTLNLPRIAMESEGSKELFWKILNERLSIAGDALTYKAERCAEARPENAPILYMHGAFGKRLEAGENVNQLFNKRRATVSLGYIGLYETASVFYGGQWEDNPEAKEFTLSILRKLKEQCGVWSDQYDYHFSVYSTPSESLTDRFCRLDKEKFGSVENITDKDYYTNSFHYDVRKKPTPFEKIDFEKDYPQYASGGFIHYCEYPVLKQNPRALEAVWDYAYTRVGYLGTNTPIDKCYVCGYAGEFEPTELGFRCPDCKNTDPSTCDVVKRTCGYLGNPQARPMVHGRHCEVVARQKHMDGAIHS